MAQHEEIILDFEVDAEEAVQSINDLTKANKELRKERNELNIQSEAGRKRAKEINALIDDNTAKIKNNVSAIEKQKINIGNYKSALDGVHPALGKVAEGLEGGSKGFLSMAKSALAFIATPIGAIIAALAAVFTLLKTAISSNNATLDKFENITTALGDVLTVIINRVGQLGDALVALFEGDFDKAADLTAGAFTGLAEEMENAVRAGQLYLQTARDIEDAQRELRIETAKTENEIKRLVVASKNRNLTLDEQEDLLRKALALEEQLVDKRTQIAQDDLINTTKQIAADFALRQSEEETFQAFLDRVTKGGKVLDPEVDKIIDKIEALEQARGSSLAFQEKLENNLAAIQEKRTKILEEQNKALAEQAAQERAVRRAQNIEDTSVEDPLVGAFQTQADLTVDINDRMKKDLAKRNEQFDKEEIERAEKNAEIFKAIEQSKLAVTANILGTMSSLFEQESQQYKLFASAQTIISTYAAATKAYEAAFVPPTIASPALGVAYAAAAVLQGLANLARINNVQFAEGGFTGYGGKYQPAGIVHAGEVVWSQADVARVGGPHVANSMRPTFRGYADGGVVANSLTAPIDQQMIISNALKNMPTPEVSVVEINKGQRRVKVKEQISKR